VTARRTPPRAWRVYLRVQEVLAAVLLVFIVVVTLVNVVMRYVIGASIVWADEVARMGFIWLTFIGAALAVAAGAHLAVDSLVERAPHGLRRVLTWVANLGALAFFGLLLVGGYGQAVGNMNQLSPALRIPLGYVYAGVPVSAVLMVVNLFGAQVFASEVEPERVAGPDGDIELKEIL